MNRTKFIIKIALKYEVTKDFILHGQTLTPNDSLLVFHEDTSTYQKKREKILKILKINYLQESITMKYINYYGIKII